MNNQSNKDQKNFNRQQSDKVQTDQRRSDFQQNQKSTGAQRDISPDSRRTSPNDPGLKE